MPTVTMAADSIVRVREPLSIVCRVESLIPFTVQWLKDGAVKTGQLKFKYEHF